MLASWQDLASYRGRLALTDGAFDPLHAGHVAYLRAAAEFGPLCCAVAADADIEAKGRPALLPAASRAAVVDLCRGVQVTTIKDRPTEALLAQLRPTYYIKGKDWEGKLPSEQVDTCARWGISIVYLPTVSDSSTDRLAAWSARRDADALDALERVVQTQTPASVPWSPVTDYSFEARKAIEGRHPELIKEVFQPKTVLDVGCGPDKILVRLLRDMGVKARGVDKQDFDLGIEQDIWCSDCGIPETWFCDLVICREVLEHLTIREVKHAVANLCNLSRRFVYVTTRFAQPPAHLLHVDTSDDLDPTHITMLNQDFLRTLFVLNGGKRRRDLEARMDWRGLGRVLVYEVTR